MKKEKFNLENTFIHLIDLPSLAKMICRELNLPPLEIRFFNGFIQSPKVGMMDNEMVVQLPSKDTGNLEILLYKPNEKTEKGTIMHTIPENAITIAPHEIVPYLLPNTITIAEFVKDRRI